MNKKLPLNLASFPEIISENYLYIDKTRDIFNLIQKGKNFFLTRPRRFGKSLLVSTLKELFEGNKKLFTGLWIAEQTDYDWKPYPVVHLDFSSINYRSAETMSRDLSLRLQEIAAQLKVSVPTNENEIAILRALIQGLTKNVKVVLLVDEYDAPIIGNLNNPEELRKIHQQLANFYGVIKSFNHLMHFLLLTGVSKFARVSVFSGLNNLVDISEQEVASSLLGYTETEIDRYLLPYLPRPDCREDLRLWYNGYRFCGQDATKVYNPYSVLSFLNTGIFDNYWFSSATPTFLIELIKKKPQIILEDLLPFVVSSNALAVCEPEQISIISLLYQTGYLTIQTYDVSQRLYTLNYPNREVRESFFEHLIAMFGKQQLHQSNYLADKLRNSLESQQFLAFAEILKTLFAHVPSVIRDVKERHFHSLLQIALSVAGLKAQSEFLTDQGRIYLVLELSNNFYIFEIKTNASAQVALNQIHAQKYFQRFLAEGKKIILVGLNINYTASLEVEIEVKTETL